MKFFIKARRKLFCLGVLFSIIPLVHSATLKEPDRLIDIVKEAVILHPLVQAASEKLNQASADARANRQPIYNPALSIDYESNIDDISTIGISQTIDWSDKRESLQKIGMQNKAAAEAEYIVTQQKVAASFLKKINQFQSSEQASAINSQQISILEKFLEIAKLRFKAGDISQIDLDLVLLAAGEVRMNSAKIQADYFTAETELSAFLNFKKVFIPEIPLQIIQVDNTPVEQLLANHFLLKQLRLRSQAALAQIKLANRSKSADPTVSFNAGKEGDESIYNVGFSIPLFVRNNFNAQVDSAIANAAAVEQQYKNSYRQVLVAVKSSRKNLQLTYDAYQKWIGESQLGLQQRSQLLQKLWKSGDLSTADYLVQIQQTLNTQISVIQLKAQVIDAWVDYLLASGNINSWLSLSTEI